MNKGFKRGLAIALCAGLSVSMLAGCSKKEEKSATKAAITVNGNKLDEKTANFLVRYNQAQFENGIGQLYAMYGYTDIWNQDLYGTGEPYSEVFKQELQEEFKNMILAQEHAADYNVELTEDDKAAISKAAADFIASNGADTLEKMSADQETVEKALTLYAYKAKVEAEMVKDVDTEVSDEEAAQRTVSYVNYTATTEADTEAVTEGETEALEETMTAAEEPETLVAEAEMTEVEDVKTGSADETELENAAEEAVTEAATEAESETDTPEMEAAKAECRAMAEAFLATALEADSFEEAAAAENEANDKSRTSSFTFGDDDTYPDAAIIEATKGLADDTVVDHVVQVGNTFYVLHVDQALDREATDQKKEEIVEQRKQDKITELYTGYLENEEATVDADVFANMLFNFTLTQETEAATEGAELMSEEILEEGTELVAEEVLEGTTEAVSEAVSEAVTEAGTEDARVE